MYWAKNDRRHSESQFIYSYRSVILNNIAFFGRNFKRHYPNASAKPTHNHRPYEARYRISLSDDKTSTEFPPCLSDRAPLRIPLGGGGGLRTGVLIRAVWVGWVAFAFRSLWRCPSIVAPATYLGPIRMGGAFLIAVVRGWLNLHKDTASTTNVRMYPLLETYSQRIAGRNSNRSRKTRRIRSAAKNM